LSRPHRLPLGEAILDVVVVGAGPAGSAAAAVLAGLGRQVHLLEAARFPRDKVCGDVLLPELAGWVERLGGDWDALSAGAVEVAACRYTVPSGRSVTGRFADGRGQVHPWRILQRRIFDERLARHAARRGARLLEGHRVVELQREGDRTRLRVITPHGERTLQARLVIAADGAGSRVARVSGLRPDAGDRPSNRFVALRTYVPWSALATAPGERSGARQTMEVIADRRLLPGCAWILPAPGGVANVGLGMVAADRAHRGVHLQALFSELFGELLQGRLAGRFDLAAAAAPVGWRLPGGMPDRRCTADGLLLAGDAAGMIDPFTGHGIHTAVQSGIYAAEAADQALARGQLTAEGEPLRGYERRWRRALADDFRIGRWLQRCHARPVLAELAAWRAAGSARWADRFLGLVGHAVPRRQALSLGMLRAALGPSGRWPVPAGPEALGVVGDGVVDGVVDGGAGGDRFAP
jgi:geranylgeranyl reductase family protein